MRRGFCVPPSLFFCIISLREVRLGFAKRDGARVYDKLAFPIKNVKKETLSSTRRPDKCEEL